MRHSMLALPAVLACSMSLQLGAHQPQLAAKPADDAAAGSSEAKTNPRWLLKLDKLDRAFIEELVGFAPPEFTEDLRWTGSEARTWADFKGKVVVVQTWSSQSSAGRTWPARAARATQGWTDSDVVVLALHTPDGADKADEFLARRELEMPGIIDATGTFCDALGAYRNPVNFVIDRAGTVRYVGLNEDGITGAVAMLVEEQAATLPAPKTRDGEAAVQSGPAPEFPAISGSVGSAMDVRGKRAPEFHVAEWIANKPRGVDNKVVIIDFWATWCGPCVAAIPHMNEIAAAFPDDVAVIGISSEKRGDFDKGIKKVPHKINYGIALDPSSKMAGAIQVRGIPHVVVLSSDWVVRWQGHPGAGLTKELVGQIVAANKGGTGGGGSNARQRWASKK